MTQNQMYSTITMRRHTVQTELYVLLRIILPVHQLDFFLVYEFKVKPITQRYLEAASLIVLTFVCPLGPTFSDMMGGGCLVMTD